MPRSCTYLTPQRSARLGKRFSVGKELCCLDDVRMRMCCIPYRNAFSEISANPPDLLTGSKIVQNNSEVQYLTFLIFFIPVLTVFNAMFVSKMFVSSYRFKKLKVFQNQNSRKRVFFSSSSSSFLFLFCFVFLLISKLIIVSLNSFCLSHHRCLHFFFLKIEFYL